MPEEFKTVDDLLNYNKSNTNTSVAVENLFNEKADPFYSQDLPQTQISDEFPSPRIANHPGFWETTKLQFKTLSDYANVVGSMEKRSDVLANPGEDNPDPGYTPLDDPSNFYGLDKKFWGRILEATNKNDARRAYFAAKEQQENEEDLSNGTLLGKIVGGGLAIGTNISSYVPMAASLKYASFGKNVLTNLARMAPGISLSAASHEAFAQANDVNGNLENYVMDTVRDTVAGMAFVGGIEGLGYGFYSSKLWDARKAFNLNYKGIDILPVLNKDGSVKELKASPALSSVGAAEVDDAQKFLDSAMAKNGLFAVPYIGGYIGKGAATINPIFRMLNSRFSTMQGFADRVYDHALITAANLKGYASPDKFEVKMARLQGANKDILYQLRGLWYARNGISGRTEIAKSTKELYDRVKGNSITREQFSDEIRDVLINEAPSSIPAVNEAARLVREHIDNSYKEFRKAYNLPEDWLPPKTAEGYLMRSYDIPRMKLRQNEWNEMIIDSLKESDGVINSHMRPIKDMDARITDAEEQHEKLIRGKNVTDEEVKNSREYIDSLRRAHKVMQENLQNELRSNPDLRIHVDDWKAVSANEAKQILQLTKRQRIAEKEIKAQKKIIDDIKDDIQKRQAGAKKAKTIATARKKNYQKDTTELVLEKEQAKLDILLKEHDEEVEKLQDQMARGEIDQNLFYKIPGSERYELKDPINRLKFREVYGDDEVDPRSALFKRENAAKAYYDTITNQTPEETAAQVMGHLTGVSSENPIKQRTLLIPDTVLYKNNFLQKDIAVNMMTYTNMLGRRTFAKQVLSDVTLDGGIENISNRLLAEYKNMKQPLSDKVTAAEKKLNSAKEPKEIKEAKKELKDAEKELNQLNKEFESNKQDLANSYSKMMGRTRISRNVRLMVSGIRSFAAATRLGGVPVTQITDLMAIAMKHGLWPFVRDGIMPAIKTLNGYRSTRDSEEFRMNCSDANLGLNEVLTGYHDKNWGGSSIPYEPVGNRVVNGLEKLAHYSANLAGTNYIENFLQRVTANIAQAQIMRHVMAYKAGTLAEKDNLKLLRYGLDLKQWGDDFHEGWVQTGKDGNGLGSFQSRYWEWQNLEAANKMSDTIFRITRDTVIRRGMGDAPFWMDNPVFATIFTFKGWNFASLTRYVLPMLQNPTERNQLMGMVLMLSAGGLVDPLRRITRGDEPFKDDDNLWWSAFSNSGIFSFFTDAIEDANIMTGGYLMKNLRNDRYQDRSFFGVAGGPVGGILEDIYHVAGMGASREWNQNDMNKMARLIPAVQAWQFRGLMNKMVESMNLPQNRTEARAQNQT